MRQRLLYSCTQRHCSLSLSLSLSLSHAATFANSSLFFQKKIRKKTLGNRVQGLGFRAYKPCTRMLCASASPALSFVFFFRPFSFKEGKPWSLCGWSQRQLVPREHILQRTHSVENTFCREHILEVVPVPNRAQHPKPAKMKLNITQTWSLSKTKGKTGKKNLKTSFVFIWKKHLVSCKKRKNLVSMWVVPVTDVIKTFLKKKYIKTWSLLKKKPGLYVGGPSHRCYQAPS